MLGSGIDRNTAASCALVCAARKAEDGNSALAPKANLQLAEKIMEAALLCMG